MTQRILIVDDDRATLDGLRALLVAWGYEVETAPDGRAALGKIASVHPAVVITDVVMPVMNGLELLGALQVMRPAPPVIVVTAHSSVDTFLVATAGGVFAYLPKPVDVAKLKTVLVRALTEAKWETAVS